MDYSPIEKIDPNIQDKIYDLEKGKTVAAKVTSIVNDLIKPGMSELEKVRTLYNYLVTNTKYATAISENTYPESAYDAYGALIEGSAVCMGYSQALQILLKKAGIENTYVSGKGNGGSHAWNLVRIDGKYGHFDATSEQKTALDAGVYSFFGVTDSELEKFYYTWDKMIYPPAN